MLGFKAADLFDCRLGFALNLVATYLCEFVRPFSKKEDGTRECS
mgnify:FL=1